MQIIWCLIEKAKQFYQRRNIIDIWSILVNLDRSQYVNMENVASYNAWLHYSKHDDKNNFCWLLKEQKQKTLSNLDWVHAAFFGPCSTNMPEKALGLHVKKEFSNDDNLAWLSLAVP